MAGFVGVADIDVGFSLSMGEGERKCDGGCSDLIRGAADMVVRSKLVS